MSGRFASRLLIGLAVLGAILYMKMQRRADDSKQIRADILQVIASMPEYPANKKVLDSSANLAHSVAFDAAYTVGGRRQANKFDEDKYVDQFFTSMINNVRTFGTEPLVKPLMALRDRFNADRQASGAAPKP